MGNDKCFLEWDDWAQRIYLVEVARQCTFALLAATELTESLQRDGIRERSWYATQSFLTSTANVSKLLYPAAPGEKNKPEVICWRLKRGKMLRELLGVKIGDPLLDRKVRNGFEHIDEKIDEWLIRQPRPTIEQVEGGNAPFTPESPTIPLRIVRPKDGVISFRDVEVDIVAVVRRLTEILEKARELEPLTGYDPGLGALLATLPTYPPELRLNAPSRRPHEPLTSGLEISSISSLEDALRVALKSLNSPP